MSFFKFAENTALALERLLAVVCLGLVVTIIGAISAQIIFRAVPSVTLTSTDEIAQIALTWLTFLGAAWIYRTGEHIKVDLLKTGAPSGWVHRGISVAREIIVLAIAINFLLLIKDAMPMSMKLRMGTLELTRFQIHFLPLAIGTFGICLFAIERIMRAILGHPAIEELRQEDLA